MVSQKDAFSRCAGGGGGGGGGILGVKDMVRHWNRFVYFYSTYI